MVSKWKSNSQNNAFTSMVINAWWLSAKDVRSGILKVLAKTRVVSLAWNYSAGYLLIGLVRLGS